MRIAVLHPGEMGISIAHALRDAGQEVGWVSAGRSKATAARAGGLHELPHLAALKDWADGVVSVCPPANAVELAQAVQETGFSKIYVDANAIAPENARRVADIFGDCYVDGGIIGPPAKQAGTTRLYLSGQRAATVQAWFANSCLAAQVIGEGTTQASALKMAYAAYTKGNSALLLAVAAMAESAGVRAELESEWAISQPQLLKASHRAAKGTSRKAWRFVGEMEQIATTFDSHGLPDDFHTGAAEVYRRMSALQDLPPAELDLVLAHLLDQIE